tara:strand:+ start:7009 stop:8037 length:1029 start_codon:yes stop_codon:yes gene_type:complete
MKTGNCVCGNQIFFNNHRCLSCDATLGRCGRCHTLTSFSANGDESICDCCGAIVHACVNQKHAVCNSFNADSISLCRWCEFTDVIPMLGNPECVRRWAAMETAKRRLLLQLEQLELPPFIANIQNTHPLRFEFLEDTVEQDGSPRKVKTGHENGRVTINLAEADTVHRERVRVQLGEPQRTLIGHMRHEVGHYIDWAWANRVDPGDYQRLFGDPDAIDYVQAMERHYAQGAPKNWAGSHVSAYATMHPWEDFAETVNVYLDIMAIATTATDLGNYELDLSPSADAVDLVASVLEIAVRVSEYNFDLGLTPLLPERMPPPVLEKLAYVHGLRSKTLVPAMETP